MDERIQVAGRIAYAGQTTVHPLGLLLVVVLGLSVLLLPRRWSVVPFLVMACFVSSAQRIVIVGLDFDFLRIMVLFGVGRLILRNEYIRFTWKPLDTAIVLWTISAVFFFVIQVGTVSTLINRLGFAFDAFGMYFLFRCLILDWQDVGRIILGFILIAIPVACFFLVEKSTGRNVFAIFGGVPEITFVRKGRLRCQGAFSHAILAGCFWAAVMPLMAACWWESSKGRVLAIAGLTASMVIVFCCASSTPVLGVGAIVIGGLMFYLRRRMRYIRWGVLLTLIALHIVMKAPVWHLISRISAVGGSTGFHRYKVINETIKNFSDWWFCGCSGLTVASWGIWKGDVTNQYILEGIRGGLVTMCLFIVVIVIAFREVGKLWRLQVRNRYRLAISWALGVSLFAQCVMFIGVSYFGQIWIIWYLLLAIIVNLSSKSPAVLPKF